MSHVERCWKDCGDEDSLEISSIQTSTRKSINFTKRKQLQVPTKSPIIYSNSQHQNQCSYTNWSAWSPCSKTCGDSAVQIRTRNVLNRSNTHLCLDRLEERVCEVLPCIVNRFNYKNRF